MQQKIHFECDYTEGAHPKILKRLMETNMEQTVGYGEDPYCQKAAELIRGLCKKEEAAVHFLVRRGWLNAGAVEFWYRQLYWYVAFVVHS